METDETNKNVTAADRKAAEKKEKEMAAKKDQAPKGDEVKKGADETKDEAKDETKDEAKDLNLSQAPPPGEAIGPGPKDPSKKYDELNPPFSETDTPQESYWVVLDRKVLPSLERTILVEPDDTYGGAHNYKARMNMGFDPEKGPIYSEELAEINFVKKLPTGEVIPGLQSEQLIYMLIDRIEKLDRAYPDKNNKEVIAHLNGAIYHLEKRVQERIKAGTMGKLEK